MQPLLTGRSAIYPFSFFDMEPSLSAADQYFSEESIRKLVQFFLQKGLATLKEEDREETWYHDWIAYQREHRLYAQILTPSEYSKKNDSFDVLRYARFMEVMAYCSPAHGYSLQVSFLGFMAILMGNNPALKQEAAAALDAGRLLAFGISERRHGSDLLSNEFTISGNAEEGLLANGEKYYIGNAHAAAMIAILGRKTSAHRKLRATRAPFLLMALRPDHAPGFQSLGKIHTLGVRAAHVGAFKVDNHRFPISDVVAEDRHAWEAVSGAITLGKLFLGFGSVGICERAFFEAVGHLKRRMLYGEAAIRLSHIRATMTEAYCRLTAMKLYAYRALDYVHAASPSDRRYPLYCAVQKARVSTEGVTVMSLLEECIGAKGFEAETFFEMALRDIQLIPGLEGSVHINLGRAMQYVNRYFERTDAAVPEPPSLVAGEIRSRENPYLLARSGSAGSVAFRPLQDAFAPLEKIPNVRQFAQQAVVVGKILKAEDEAGIGDDDLRTMMALGRCFATIVYAQLVAENVAKMDLSAEVCSIIFAFLIEDLNAHLLALALLPNLPEARSRLVQEGIRLPQTDTLAWEAVAETFQF